MGNRLLLTLFLGEQIFGSNLIVVAVPAECASELRLITCLKRKSVPYFGPVGLYRARELNRASSGL